ncbi:hypothetical protein [Nocardia sp. XZ_19_369]|uniref:hypothetical protein n=1 Tax=Nocardia sp. XZ_19_369 TaxID=2769487 RepID=UPI00188EC981|nr:hypothetical protein [Nocardia sp. XZ_19_369]
MSVFPAWLRGAAYALWALPLAVGPVAPRLRVPRRLLGEPITPRDRLAVRATVHRVLSGALGLVTWFLAFLAVLAAVRGVLYPLVASDDYGNSWGGPTLAGAWAVHALLGLGLLPVCLLLLTALGALQVRLARAVLGRARSPWPIPVTVVLCALGVLLFLAWLSQV